MTERVITALRGLGIEASPLAVLEGEEAFFALLGDLLIYQDGQGTRRVTLRDLTRIRSDADGLLRVETPAGTALTASLLGFEPSQVQGFFAEVRDATARAKNLPPAPLPTAGGFKTFGSAPAASAAAPTPPPVPTPSDAKPNLPGPAEVEAVNSGAIEAEPAKAELTQANRPRPEPIKLGGPSRRRKTGRPRRNRTAPSRAWRCRRRSRRPRWARVWSPVPRRSRWFRLILVPRRRQPWPRRPSPLLPRPRHPPAPCLRRRWRWSARHQSTDGSPRGPLLWGDCPAACRSSPLCWAWPPSGWPSFSTRAARP